MKLPAGRYFIGDPCYVIKDELWQDYCNELEEAERYNFNGFFKFKGQDVFVSSTAHGDGSYYDADREYVFGVDAGLIGATPLDLGITEDNLTKMDKLGLVVEYEDPFTCYALDDEGNIDIGPIKILTDDWGDDDEYDDEYYDDDDDY